ncbi:MAG: phage tail tape measure C-terminal domain-containing protein, partial [Gillisia sp.]
MKDYMKGLPPVNSMTGKASFKDLVSSILADLARLVTQQAVTGPLASLLSAGISAGFGAIRGSFGRVTTGTPITAGQLPPASAFTLHRGGIAGRDGLPRAVDPAVFAGAPRMHTGGIAGLRPDEVPAIL